jgi:hypothetical protein
MPYSRRSTEGLNVPLAVYIYAKRLPDPAPYLPVDHSPALTTSAYPSLTRPLFFWDLFEATSMALRSLLLGAVAAGHLAGAASVTCSASAPLSCHNTTSYDTCCLNYPGGHLLLTQFWDTDPATGPSNSWTIHGLWYGMSLDDGEGRS